MSIASSGQSDASEHASEREPLLRRGSGVRGRTSAWGANTGNAFGGLKRTYKSNQLNVGEGRFALPVDSIPKVSLAALYIQDAMECNAIRPYRDMKGPHRSNRIRQMLYYPRWLAVIGLAVLTFIEDPRWCRENAQCSNYATHPSWQINLIGWRASQAYEACCLFVMAFDLGLWFHVLGSKYFIRWPARVVHTGVVLISIIDLLINVFGSASDFRLSPYFRMAFVALYSPQLRRELKFLTKTLPELFKVLLLLTCYCVAFAWFGVVLFPNDGEEGRLYFHEFGSALWNLAILLTTNNFPDVMMPAYAETRLYFFFFLVFTIGGIYFFINLLTGVVYNAYQDAKRQDVEDMIRHREEGIDAAFNCCAVSRDPATGERYISSSVLEELCQALNKNFHVRYIAQPEFAIIFGLLDRDGDHSVSRKEFKRFPVLLNCEFNRVDLVLLQRWFPKLWKSSVFQLMRKILSSSPQFSPISLWYPWPCIDFFTQYDYSLFFAVRIPGFGRTALSGATSNLYNIELRFSSMPTLDEVSDLARQVIEEALPPHLIAEFGFRGYKILDFCIHNDVYDVWHPVTSSFQLFDTCQLYLRSGSLRPDSLNAEGTTLPHRTDLPEAITPESFFEQYSHTVKEEERQHEVLGGGTLRPHQHQRTSVASSSELDTQVFTEENGPGETEPLLRTKRRGSKPIGSNRHSAYWSATSVNTEQVSKFPSWYTWREIKILPPTSSIFDLAVDVIVILNGVLVVTETWGYLTGSTNEITKYSWRTAIDYVFTIIYVVEVFFKLGIYGLKRYWGSYQNRFDFFVAVLALVTGTILLYPNTYEDPRLLKFVVMARMLRLLRVLAILPWFSMIFSTFVAALPTAKKVSLLFFSLMYFFSYLGTDIFGGKINTNMPTNTMTPWVWMNFNDLSGGFVMLFACLIMNNWNSYVAGYVAVTDKTARIYFTSFWVLGALAGLNLVVSFILDKFNEEWDQIRDQEERRKDPRDGSAKTRAEFLQDGFTMQDWVTAERISLGQGEAWSSEAGWTFNAKDITGTQTGETGDYVLRFTGDSSPLLRGKDGNLVTRDTFIRNVFTRSSSANVVPFDRTP
eukprot:TRINITY_DN4805_c0_g1_i1.p1 TRINITY_DN4805_c0_g1~~TRINITY_DN4805_c0_g1_i1.p1  ORF type:complete len:1083 (+),score=99.79 TRINITY_DN4805_c0_g1_i1:618-3866(+)